MRISLLKTERLRAVCRLLGSCTALADVGCDHGYLSAELIMTGRAERAIASDISPVSAAKAARLAESLGISDRMTALTADGLDCLNGVEPPYSIAVCGMGGELIASIIERGFEAASRAERIVMQPMRGEAELRRYLFEHDFRIEDERVIREGRRFYQVISAVPNRRDMIPEGFPQGWFRFGWVMARRDAENLMPLLAHYASVYKRELSSAERKGRRPEGIVAELERTEALMRFIEKERAEKHAAE